MRSLFKFEIVILVCALLGGPIPACAQQKPQWMPGQEGLNAGILPSPGITFVNVDTNYNASAFNGPGGKALPVTGTYDIWVVENVFYYVPPVKVLGGNLGFMVMYPTPASGSLVADFPHFPSLAVSGGGEGIADTWIQPFTLGWHLKRADIWVGDAIMYPTGRYAPGASNNIGSGYYGNHLQTGTTYYITKNKGTSANLFTDWEVHGQRPGTDNTHETPGQAFTDEWGVGQILPLKKNFTQLLQFGVIGYDQWQLTANSGTVSIGGIIVPAGLAPLYSVHAVGGQLNYILPVKNFSLFFKYEHEYAASSHFVGNTCVFGGAWTWLHPKPAAANP
jgi:hypothetical protein